MTGTAWPYRTIASLIERGNPSVKIAGITGTLHSGLGVDSITWGDDPLKRSEVLGLRIQYSGVAGQGGKYRVVVHDAGVRKALSSLIRSVGNDVRVYESTGEFLKSEIPAVPS